MLSLIYVKAEGKDSPFWPMDSSEMTCPTQRVSVCLPSRRGYPGSKSTGSAGRTLAQEGTLRPQRWPGRWPPGAAHAPGMTPGLTLWSFVFSHGLSGWHFLPQAFHTCRACSRCPLREHMLQHTRSGLYASPQWPGYKPACLAATSAHSPFGLFLGLSGFSTSMDVIRKNKPSIWIQDCIEDMEGGLLWRELLRAGQLQANGEGIARVGTVAHLFAGTMSHKLKAPDCVYEAWSVGHVPWHPDLAEGKQEGALADEGTCVFWLHAVEKIPELPRSDRHHLCCFPLKKCQLLNGSYFQRYRGRSKISSKRDWEIQDKNWKCKWLYAYNGIVSN